MVLVAFCTVWGVRRAYGWTLEIVLGLWFHFLKSNRDFLAIVGERHFGFGRIVSVWSSCAVVPLGALGAGAESALRLRFV